MRPLKTSGLVYNLVFEPPSVGQFVDKRTVSLISTLRGENKKICFETSIKRGILPPVYYKLYLIGNFVFFITTFFREFDT